MPGTRTRASSLPLSCHGIIPSGCLELCPLAPEHGKINAPSIASLVQSHCVVFPELAKHPVDGFSAGLVDDENVFEWQITIMGPPDTL